MAKNIDKIYCGELNCIFGELSENAQEPKFINAEQKKNFDRLVDELYRGKNIYFVTWSKDRRRVQAMIHYIKENYPVKNIMEHIFFKGNSYSDYQDKMIDTYSPENFCRTYRHGNIIISCENGHTTCQIVKEYKG